MPSKSRKWFLLALGVLVVGFLLYRSRSSFHLGQSWHAVRSADSRYIIAAVLLIYFCYFLRALRWQNFQKHLGNSRLFPIFNMTLAGFSAIYLFSRAGEPVRPLLISRKDKIPLADTFGIYALERVLDMGFAAAMLAIWFVIATLQKLLSGDIANPGLEGVRKTAGTIVTFGVLGIAIFALYVRFYGARMLEGQLQLWMQADGWRANVARVVFGVVRGLRTIKNWRDLAYAITISAAHWILIILVYHLVEFGFGGALSHLRFQDSMLIVALTMVGSLLQLPGIGGGPQAVMTAAFTRFYGVDGGTAFAAAMVVYLVTFAACSLAGVPLLLKEGLSLGELRRMREQEDKEIDAEIMAHAPHEAPESAPHDAPQSAEADN